MDSEGDVKLEMFNGKTDDFSLWATRMEAILEAKDLMGIISGEEVKPDASNIVQVTLYHKRVRKVRAFLINSLGDRPLRAVQSSKDDPQAMWKKLHDRYATSSSASRIQIQTALHTKKIKAGETMADFIDGFESLFTRLASMNSEVKEDMQVAILLAALSSEKEYENVIAALKTLPQEALTWDDVTARLIEESKSKTVKKGSQTFTDKGKLLKTTTRGRNARSKGKENRPLVCYICKEGHRGPECPYRGIFQKILEEQKRKGKVEMNSGSSGSDAASKPKLLFTAFKSDFTSSASSDEVVIDSGASHHMFMHKSWFSSLQEIPLIEVEGAKKGSVSLCSMKGTVDLNVFIDGSTKSTWVRLTDALYVPDIDTNLLSATALDLKGVQIRMQGGRCYLWDGSEMFGMADLDGRFYKLRAKPRVGVAKILSTRGTVGNDLDLWHKRLGHTNKETIKQMLSSDTVMCNGKNSGSVNKDICGPCQFGKQRRTTFKGHFDNDVAIGEVIHSDLCGPLSTKSCGGARYFVTFIDQRTRFTTTVAIRRKNEATKEFHNFRTFFERQYDCHIKTLHSDNGGEYEGIREYLQENGIRFT